MFLSHPLKIALLSFIVQYMVLSDARSDHRTLFHMHSSECRSTTVYYETNMLTCRIVCFLSALYRKILDWHQLKTEPGPEFVSLWINLNNFSLQALFFLSSTVSSCWVKMDALILMAQDPWLLTGEFCQQLWALRLEYAAAFSTPIGRSYKCTCPITYKAPPPCIKTGEERVCDPYVLTYRLDSSM